LRLSWLGAARAGRPPQLRRVTTLAQARKLIRQACHILAELGDDALAAA